MKLIINFITALFIISNIYSSDIHSQDTEYLAFADQMPQPVGGIEAIYKLIEYPQEAKSAGIEGKVFVLAFINENGNVDEAKVIKGLGYGCDQATIDAVYKSKFVPGKFEGKPSKVKLSLQIQFKL